MNFLLCKNVMFRSCILKKFLLFVFRRYRTISHVIISLQCDELYIGTEEDVNKCTGNKIFIFSIKGRRDLRLFTVWVSMVEWIEC